MKAHLLPLLLLAFSPGGAGAEPPYPWTVRVEVQIVAVPMGEALQLVPRLRHAESFAAAAQRVRELISGDQADLLGWPVVQGLSGQKATAISTDEVRFGTEYGPPKPPHVLMGDSQPPDISSIFYPKHLLPAEREAQDSGLKLEIESRVDPATSLLDITIALELMRLEALEPWIGARHQATSDRAQTQPRFSTCKVRTKLSLPNGGQTLLGTAVEQPPQSRVVLFLLHAIAQPPPAP